MIEIVNGNLLKFYYFGECGAAVKWLFPALEALQHSIELVIWKNLNEIINLISPNKFITKNIETYPNFNLPEYYRTATGNDFENDFTKYLDNLGYKRVFDKTTIAHQILLGG